MPKATGVSFPERKKAAMYDKTDVWQGRAARFLVIVLLCIQPLYLSPDRYIELTYHKWSFFVFTMVVALLCVIAIWVYRLTRKPVLGPRGGLNFIDYAVLIFAIVTIISALASPFRGAVDLAGQRPPMNVWIGIQEPEGRYDGAITQLLYVCVFFIVSRWYKPNIKDFMVFGVAASLVALVGVFQFFGMDFFRLWPNHIAEFRVENFFEIFFRTTIGNVNIVSTFASFAILLCGFLFIRLKSKWQPLWLAASALNFWLLDISNSDSGIVGVAVTVFLAIPFIIETRKYFGRALVLLSSWAAVFTLQRLLFDANILRAGEISRFFEYCEIQAATVGSLLPFVAVFAVLLVAGLLLMKFSPEKDPQAPVKWRLGVILVAAFLAAGLIGVEFLGRDAAERGDGFAGRILYEAREVLHGNIRPEMGSARVHIWQNALRVVPDNPIIGSGPDTFEFAFPEDAQGFMYVRFDTAHNEYVQILVTHGILGLLAYLVFLGGVFVTSVRKAFHNPLLMAVMAAFVGYGVQAFFNISLPIVSMALWVFAGMLTNSRMREAASEDLR